MSWIFLSHVLSENTPLYGGKGHIRLTRQRSMAAGDSSNNSDLALPAHAGTHVDAPRHFDPSGATVDAYPTEHWIATQPWLLDVPCEPGMVLNLSMLDRALGEVPADCDLLLIRTGAEQWRVEDPETYALNGPGIGPDVADWLRRERRLRFLGFDFISASSFAHREVGRLAHRVFLGKHASGKDPVLLVEDMALAKLERAPVEVHVIPLRYTAADGAPVTVLARCEYKDK